MRFQSPFLLTAADYSPMFKGLLKVDPGAKGQVDHAMGWAKSFLKKQDRIVWFLRWVRVALAESLIESPGWGNLATSSPEAIAFRKALEPDIRHLGGYTLRSLKESLEHYLSLPVPEIQSYVFNPREDPPRVLQGTLAILENKFQEERRGLIQPRPEDKAILTFPDGWAWFLLPRAYCPDEAKAIGHCGNTHHARIPSSRYSPSVSRGRSASRPGGSRMLLL